MMSSFVAHTKKLISNQLNENILYFVRHKRTWWPCFRLLLCIYYIKSNLLFRKVIRTQGTRLPETSTSSFSISSVTHINRTVQFLLFFSCFFSFSFAFTVLAVLKISLIELFAQNAFY